MESEAGGVVSQRPVLRHIANLWTLQQHPSRAKEWDLRDKLEAIRDAGFDGVCWAPGRGLCEMAREMGLMFVGGMVARHKTEVPRMLRELSDGGARHVNVQLGSDDLTPADALDMTIALMGDAEELGLLPAIEFHRGTYPETPGKAYALADAYEQATGRLLRISWDFSHFAVVKHLVASEFEERLLVRKDLVQHAQQFHFRPFNGHHVQVPVAGAPGELTQEVRDWLPFAEAVMRCWLAGSSEKGREIFICPELGPVEGGYALSTFPNSWEEAKALRAAIDELWNRVVR